MNLVIFILISFSLVKWAQCKDHCDADNKIHKIKQHPRAPENESLELKIREDNFFIDFEPKLDLSKIRKMWREEAIRDNKELRIGDVIIGMYNQLIVDVIFGVYDMLVDLLKYIFNKDEDEFNFENCLNCLYFYKTYF